jgi:5-methylthioribose kinase
VRKQRLLRDEDLAGYLRERGLAGPDEPVAVEPAGDGNINWVRRAWIGAPRARSLIVKQARPALERFPEYRAPTERLLFEARYGEVAAPFDVEGVLPRVLAVDADDRVLVLEDLGEAERLDAALARGADATDALVALAAFLGRVHAGTRDDASLAARFENGAMQRLHGDHIFALPFAENAFPLPPRTAERARGLWRNEALRAAAARTYARFLEPRGALVHGDVQPANVLLARTGPKLLDAEIAHVGDPAFDVGSLLAHVALPAVARGDVAPARAPLRALWEAYAEAHGADGLPARADALGYGGLELLRRTLGAARVAAVASDEAGLRVVDAGLAWTLAPSRAEAQLF